MAEGSVVLTRPAPGHAAVTVHGRLDAMAAETFRDHVATFAHHGIVHVVVDLSGAELVDPAGLAAIVDADRRCSWQGGSVVVAGVRTDAVGRVFRLSGLDLVLTLVDVR